MNTGNSQDLFRRASALMPGGVSSPVRAWRAVGGVPIHVLRGDGASIFDVDGNEFIDLVLSFGPLILGHGYPGVTEALHAAIECGTTFGTPTEGEFGLAKQICERLPAVDMVRFVNSGTEATMSALRLARASTGRDHVIKFNGCYHGHGDSFLVKAGSGALTLGQPDSPGVPSALAELTLVAAYNDLASVRELFEAHAEQVACIFVEPVAGNMGCVLPVEGFLTGLRDLCDEFGALLVFDEVMTGFRVARGGYMELTDVRPDLVTLGKVIGGGLPVGAYGGRRDLMQQVSPAGDVYQAGTLSGNPLAMAAGRAMLTTLDSTQVYDELEQAGARLEAGLMQAATDAGVPLYVGRQGSMLCPYIASEPVTSLDDVTNSDRERWKRFFHGMLGRGVLLPPSPYECWFLSTAHDDAIIDRVVSAAQETLAEI